MTTTHFGPPAQQLASQFGFASVDHSADAAIELVIRSLLTEAPLSKTASVDVAVCDGVLRMDGTVSDGLWLARFKNQVTSALPSITIDDRLDWVLPDCGIGVA